MNRAIFRAALAAAALSLAACGKGDAADDTQPAGQQPAPSTQAQAAPQTGPAPSTPADYVEPPVLGRDTHRAVGPGQTYATCMAQASGKGEGEREVLERTCRHLPDAPPKR